MEGELEKIINKAIPLRNCPMDKEADNMRRKWLLKELNKYISEHYEQIEDKIKIIWQH